MKSVVVVAAVVVACPARNKEAERLVEDAVVANDEVEVAFVVVELSPVKFCKVVEEVTRRLVVVALPLMVNPDDVVPPPMVEDAVDWKPERIPKEVREEVTTFEARVVPVSDPAGAEPEILPVRFPVRLPVPEVKKRLVVEAVPAKKFVVVAFVVVELSPVKFAKVDDAYARILFVVKVPMVAEFAKSPVVEAWVPTYKYVDVDWVALREPIFARLALICVVEARVDMYKVVVVALVVVAVPIVTPPTNVVEAPVQIFCAVKSTGADMV